MFGWLSKETKSFYVARPSEQASDLIFLHPDKSIARGAKLTVRSDECALFFREGRYIGTIDSGTTVQIDTANIPFLGHALVDKFTDANHFLTELFFVSLKESICQIPSVELGQYRDRNSANVVSISGMVSYTVRVKDPVKLVVELGGQSAGSGQTIQHILNGRVLNQIRKAVGNRTAQQPVLDVVSNVDAEAISQEITQLCEKEFLEAGISIGRMFDLTLALGQESIGLLTEYGRQESELTLQEKGARLATKDGFAEYNVIQGQRAALEGLGKGLGSGGGPAILTGLNLGANLTGGVGATRSRSNSGDRPRGGTVITSQSMFVLKGDAGESGPYSVRQLALLAISGNRKLNEMTIRATDDPGDAAFSADLEPAIVTEYNRRMPAAPKDQPQGAASAFDMALSALAKNGKLDASQVEMLASMAVNLGMEKSADAARVRVLTEAGRKNIRVES